MKKAVARDMAPAPTRYLVYALLLLVLHVIYGGGEICMIGMYYVMRLVYQAQAHVGR